MNSIFKELGLFCWFEGLVFIFFLSVVLLFVFEMGTSTKYLGACGSRSFKMMMPWFEEYITSSLWVNVHMRKCWLKLNISDERPNRTPPTALWAVSVTKSHNIGTILSLISWFRNSLGEKWALIASKLVSQREQKPCYFSSTRLKVKVCASICTSIWSHVHLQAICSST